MGYTKRKGRCNYQSLLRNSKEFVLEDGSLHLDEWRVAERNILEDFKEAFGAYPKQRVGGIGIHTDSDNTSFIL